MSNPDPTPAPAAATAIATAAAKTPQTKTRWQRWRRRLAIAAVILLLILVALRVILVVALPSVLRSVAGKYNLNCDYERTEMYLISGNVGIWHLTLTPKSGGDPLLDAGYCRADISALNLLRGRLVAYRLEADGVDVAVERDENGEIPLIKQFLGNQPAAKPAATTTNAGPQDIDFDSPLRIDSLRGNRVRAHLRDKSVVPPLDTQMDVNLRLSDVGSLKRPTTFQLDVTSPPLLDILRIEGEGTARGKSIDAKMTLAALGVHPGPAAGYLKLLGIRPSADSLSMSMVATVKTEAAGEQTPTKKDPGIKGSIVLAKITASSDGVEAAGVDKLIIDITDLTPQKAIIGGLLIDNVRANAKRTSDGAIRVAGVDIVGGGEQASPAATQPTASGPMMPWKIGELRIRNVQANFRDDAIVPPADLAVAITQIAVNNLASDGTELPTQVNIQMSVPGMARSVRISGTALPLAAKKSLDLKILATGVKPDAIKPYFDALGIESKIKNGTLSCDVKASLAEATGGKINADAMFGNVKFVDGSELFAFDGVTVNGAAIDPTANRIRVETINLAGPKMTVERDKDGVIGALGFFLKPRPAAMAKPVDSSTAPRPAPTTAPTVASTAPSSSPPPALEIGKLTWKGVDLHFEDQGVAPANSFALTDAGVELSDLRIDLDPKAKPAAPGKIRAWLVAPGVVGNIGVTGTVAPGPDALALDLNVSGKGLVAAKLAPYFKSTPIEPTLKDGSIQLHTQIALSRTQRGTGATLAVDKMSYVDSGKELVGVDTLRVTGVELLPEGLNVGAVEMSKPRARAARLADGSFAAAGVRIVPTTQPAPTGAAKLPPAGPVASSTAHATAPAPAKPFVVVLGKLRIADGSLNWSDAAVAPAVDVAAGANVLLDHFVLGRAAEPAKLQVTAYVDKTIQNATVGGTVSAAPDSQRVQLAIAASGITAGPLASYLPPGITANLKDGKFAVKLDAALASVPKGGQKISVIVSDLDYRDAATPAPLVKFDSARILASRFDPAGKVIAVDEVSLAGLETQARKTADGKLELLGLSVGPPPAQASAAPANPADQQTANQAAAQSVAASIPPPSTNVAELVAARKEPQPLITLDKLDVNLKSVAVTDDSRPGSSPITLADVRLHNRARVEMLGADPASHPPIDLEVTGRIDPAVQKFAVTMQAAPFAAQPTLVIDVSASGIKGDGALALAPALKPTIDGSTLTDGQFKTHLEANARFARKGPTQYDFTKPFDAEFTIRPIEFRGTPEGPVLAGLEEIRGEGIHMDPATGAIAVKTLEITKPIGDVVRDKDGIHLLGCVVKLPEAKSATTQPAEATAPQEAPVASAAPTTKPSAEIRIDNFLVSGLDFKVEDRTYDPPLLVPLNGLDVDVKGLSNLAPYEDKPVRFSVLASAGKVPLVEGAQRDLFSEVAASGNLSLYPKTHGWTKTSVSGFEILSLRGPAEANKVKIGGGVFDSTVDLRFREDGTIDTRSRLAITDLKLSEPPDGLIQRTLQLPAPLDAVILVLQDPSGAITVPLSVPIKQGQVSTGSIAGAASGAFLSIVGTAMASAPLKVAGGVGSMMGLGDKDKNKGKGPQPAGEVDFAPADVALSASATETVDQLIAHLRKQTKLDVTLKHELGGGDLERAAVLANPSPADCLAIAEQLRARKQRLLVERAELASQARAQLAAGGPEEGASTIERLRLVDRDLARTENAMDRVYEMLRPGAERQADRRTRAAAIDIAQARLDEVQAALLASGIPGIDQRIRTTRAQFNPAEGDAGGKITVTSLEKKKP